MTDSRDKRTILNSAWGEVIRWIDPRSPERAKRPSEHFGQCGYIDRGDECVLQGAKLQKLKLVMRLDHSHGCVIIDERRILARDRDTSPRRDEIQMTMNSDGRVEFKYKGRQHLSPMSLADALINHVCNE